MTIDLIVELLQERLDPSKRRYPCGSYTFLNLVAPITCADGVRLSVQASHTHYCSPRNDEGPWGAVEVGYPTVKIDSFMEYAEHPETPTDTVYGWVPIETVAAAILEHGGIKESQ